MGKWHYTITMFSLFMFVAVVFGVLCCAGLFDSDACDSYTQCSGYIAGGSSNEIEDTPRNSGELKIVYMDGYKFIMCVGSGYFVRHPDCRHRNYYTVPGTFHHSYGDRISGGSVNNANGSVDQ